MPNVPVEIPLPMGFGHATNTAHSLSDLWDLYPEKSGDGRIALYSAPGYTIPSSSANVTGRTYATEVIVDNNGNEKVLFLMTAAAPGTSTNVRIFSYDGSYVGSVGTIAATPSGYYRASIATNTARNEALICLGTDAVSTYRMHGAYPYTLTALPSLGGYDGGVCFQDGYGIRWLRGSQDWYISEVDDLGSWDALQFTNADALPGNITGIVSYNRELWVFKQSSIEVYQNTGASPFPFQRVQVIESGCPHQSMIRKVGNALMWTDFEGNVYAATGYAPQVVSTPKIAKAISASDFGAWSYSDSGHHFYGVNAAYESIYIRLVYDLTTGSWHRRSSFDGTNRATYKLESIASTRQFPPDSEQQSTGDWEPSTGITSRLLAGGTDAGEIYIPTQDVHTLQAREFITDPINAGGDKRAIMSQFWLEFKSTTTSAATIALSWTDDDGATWTSWRSAALDGTNDGNRVSWSRLGSFRRRSMRVRVVGDIDFVVLKAWARIETGD